MNVAKVEPIGAPCSCGPDHFPHECYQDSGIFELDHCIFCAEPHDPEKKGGGHSSRCCVERRGNWEALVRACCTCPEAGTSGSCIVHNPAGVHP